MPDMRRNIKDSVFTYLFSQPEYTRELYLTLHPEDEGVSESELKIVTLENILSTGQYNDLGIQVRDKLIFLVEAQSTFSANIVLRLLMYLGETYKEYVEEHKISLYSPTRASIPRPELYMVYSGDQEAVPDTLRLSDLYEGPGSVEVEVKVLREDRSGSILDQYIDFCEISNEQVKKYGRTQQAIDETIRICLGHGILAPFLGSRQKEVLGIMTQLFDQEKVWEIERYNMMKSARREGEEKGKREGEEKGIQVVVRTLKGCSIGKEMVARTLADQFGLSPSAAMEKVQKYWS